MESSAAIEQRRIAIEALYPQVDSGRYPVKAVVGDTVEVSADIFKDGHDLLRAFVLYRPLASDEVVPLRHTPARAAMRRDWRWAELAEGDNDRWHGSFEVDRIGPWAYTVVAWTDRFGTWREELRKKAEAGYDVTSELLEGRAILEAYAAFASGRVKSDLERMIAALARAETQERAVALALHPRLRELAREADPRDDATLYPFEIPVWVDRERARFGAWYEIFVRSQGRDPSRSATFREAEERLPDIAAMGFDVLYLTPIHPIGRTNRKGRNNSLRAEPGDPGSPWAIGSAEGGHTSVHPELGTIDDFDHFVAAARRVGLEVALDLAFQCSPDHPWVREHPEWFAHQPDGTIKYAENPPKKYEDIYPIDFDTCDRDGLYAALLEVVRFWIGHGVRIFRVDNPHTKPWSFWEWLIATVHRDHPEVIFLAEAFTRPKRMYHLAKLGFTQSYTYFTWRNSRWEIEEYARELFHSDVRLFFRPNFFANTPDILHEYLQRGGRPAFIARLVLAATLSPSYGIYSGFELCENTPLREGSEEYLDSEKYEIKVRNWDAPGNIKEYVRLVNRARRENRALQLACNLHILESTNQAIVAYAKTAPEVGNAVVVAVNTDPHSAQEGTVRVPRDLVDGRDTFTVRDLLTNSVYKWHAEWNYVRLDPVAGLPAHILRVE